MSDSFLFPHSSKRRLLDPSRWLAPVYLSACDDVGADVRTIGRPLVHNEGRITIGRGTTLRSLASPIRLTAARSGVISIGDAVLVDGGATLFSEVEVRIEDGVVVGPEVVICDRDEEGHTGRILIGQGVRLEAGARVIGPSQIGSGAVVLAGSVVRGTVPAGAVVRPQPEERRDAAPKAPRPTAVANVPGPTVPVRRARAVLIADFTIDELAQHLRAQDLDGLAIEPEIAPFDQVAPTLMNLSREESKQRPGRRLDATGSSVTGFSRSAPRGRLLTSIGSSPRSTRSRRCSGPMRRPRASSSCRAGCSLRPIGVWVSSSSVRPRATNVLARMNLRLADAVAGDSRHVRSRRAALARGGRRWRGQSEALVRGQGGLHDRRAVGGRARHPRRAPRSTGHVAQARGGRPRRHACGEASSATWAGSI